MFSIANQTVELKVAPDERAQDDPGSDFAAPVAVLTFDEDPHNSAIVRLHCAWPNGCAAEVTFNRNAGPIDNTVHVADKREQAEGAVPRRRFETVGQHREREAREALIRENKAVTPDAIAAKRAELDGEPVADEDQGK